MHCFGKSADRFLLDRTRGGAYHSFIFGRREIGGKITLSAGTAQGIERGTRLAFFVSDVKDTWNDKRGYLVVDSASATSAVLLRSSSDASKLPDIFYAAETQYPKEIIRVKFEGEQPPAGPFPPKSSWVLQEQNKPNITLKFENSEYVTFFWNGLDDNRRGNYEIDTFDISEPRTGRMLRNAARLTYHLSRPSPVNSLAKGLHIQLRKINGSGKEREPSGEDLLQDGCMSKTVGLWETLGPYCLVVENKTETDLWPYVLTYDPRNVNIGEFQLFVFIGTPYNIICISGAWYLPSSGTDQPTLKAQGSLPVGCGDEDGLLFEDVFRSAILYIRVFVTTEKTDFSFLRQQWISPTEDRVRELESQPVDQEVSSNRVDDDSQGKTLTSFGSTWAAKTATIVLDIGETFDSDSSDSDP